MKRVLIIAGFLVWLASPRLQAQTAALPKDAGVPNVYTPEKLSPERRQARDAVSTLRDSVSAAGGALAKLSADINTTSLQVLESRASTVVDRCAAADRQRAKSAEELATAQLTTPGELKAQKDMVAEMNSLKKTLDSCAATYQPLAKPGKGQEVRDYGNARARPIIAGLQKYEQSLKPFATDMKVQFRPLLNNAGKSPID